MKHIIFFYDKRGNLEDSIETQYHYYRSKIKIVYNDNVYTVRGVTVDEDDDEVHISAYPYPKQI